MQQTGNISPVADVYLLPGIVDSSIGIRGVLELNNANRETIDIKQNIRPTGLCLPIVNVLDGKLIDNPKYILVCMIWIEVNERNHLGRPIF